MKNFLMNTKIDKAVHVLETMCQDKKARAEYLSREMALHDEATRIEINIISQVTGLSIEKIKT